MLVDCCLFYLPCFDCCFGGVGLLVGYLWSFECTCFVCFWLGYDWFVLLGCLWLAVCFDVFTLVDLSLWFVLLLLFVCWVVIVFRFGFRVFGLILFVGC